MSESDRPTLGLNVECQIEEGQNGIDAKYWAELSALLVSTPAAQQFQKKIWPTITTLHAPIPPRPQKLRSVISNYAGALFENEAGVYPKREQLEHWLDKLRERTISKVIGKIAEIEAETRSALLSFDHHGITQNQMREAAFTGCASAGLRMQLKTVTQSLITTEHTRVAEEPLSRVSHESTAEARPQDNAEKDRRAKLLTEYKAATGSPSDYRIYKAKNSGIHKPEFYKWRNGQLSRASETTKAFEKFLQEKKPPIPRKT